MPTSLLNGKSKAKSTKMVTEEKEKSNAKPIEVEAEESTESKRITAAKKLEPEMLSDPYPIDYPGVEDSSEFCLEMCLQRILGPLGDAIPTEKDWLDFARAAWQWKEQSEERRVQIAAANEIAKIQEDPKLYEAVKEIILKR